MTIVDGAGATVTGVTVGGNFSARAVVRDAAGAAVAGRLVTFDLGGSAIATIDPDTALTNSSGVAVVAIAPASLTSKGAASVMVRANVAGTEVTGTTDFSVSAVNLSLSPIRVDSASLPSGGNTSVAVTALVDGRPLTSVPANIVYTAACGRINGAAAAAGVGVTTDGNGVASATYSAVAPDGSLCSGNVIISASSAGAASSSSTLNVAAPTATAVTFVSAVPAQIFVKGSGAVEQSIVRFRVLSFAAIGMANEPVTFTILPNPGGVGIGSAGSTSAVTVTTDWLGFASVPVFSGTIPGPVKLRAALVADSTIFAESQNLTVASGPPSQRFMSLSAETFNIEGWDIDGTSTRLTAHLADRQGNAVEDGTVINFTTEGGQVASSCATTRVNNISSCSVNFISQNPRPSDGRVSVLAYTEGTKDYVDVNFDNRFDAGDTLIQIGDAYRDDNEDSTFNAGEFRIPRNVSGAICQDAGAPFPSIANSCDSTLATTVRQQATIMFSSSSPALPPIISHETIASGTQTVTLTIGSAANRRLPMPSGTLIAARAFDSNPADGANCSVSFGPTDTPIPNIPPGTSPASDLATRHEVKLRDCRAGDSLFVDVTAPSGRKTTIEVPL